MGKVLRSDPLEEDVGVGVLGDRQGRPHGLLARLVGEDPADLEWRGSLPGRVGDPALLVDVGSRTRKSMPIRSRLLESLEERADGVLDVLHGRGHRAPRRDEVGHREAALEPSQVVQGLRPERRPRGPGESEARAGVALDEPRSLDGDQEQEEDGECRLGGEAALHAGCGMVMAVAARGSVPREPQRDLVHGEEERARDGEVERARRERRRRGRRLVVGKDGHRPRRARSPPAISGFRPSSTSTTFSCPASTRSAQTRTCSGRRPRSARA